MYDTVGVHGVGFELILHQFSNVLQTMEQAMKKFLASEIVITFSTQFINLQLLMTQPVAADVLQAEETRTNSGALATLVIVFFFWGFIAASNSIFIPFCKSHFNLDQFQSQLIDFAFYTAYFIGALILYWLSSVSKTDIL